jgi:hypothetical protein
MNNAAIIERSKAFSHPSYSDAYEAQGEYYFKDESTSYVASLNRALENSGSISFHQRGMHFTLGQIAPMFQTEHALRSGSLPAWIAHVQQLCNNGCQDAALKEISLATARIKANREFSKLNSDIKQIVLESFPDIILIALLRNTYSIRSQILCWGDLLNQTEKLLKDRNREPRFLLRGLKSYQ